jgi:DNA-binding CsgD family transcriptional regulator
MGEVRELARHRGVQLDRWSAQRLHRHTGGHVLYVLTLLGELTETQLATREGGLPAPRSLASTTVARMSDLPHEAQMLGSALAVLNQRVALELAGRVAGVDEPTRALEALLDTGFVTWRPQEVYTPIEFVHPLYRSAIYEDLSPSRRRYLHRAAASALDPDAALVHRVAAAEPGDEGLVNDLVETARRHEVLGAFSVAGREWQWVASLSSQADHVARGELEAARLFLADGQIERASGLRDQVEAGPTNPTRSLLLGMLDWTVGDGPNAERWFLDAVSLAGDGDGDGDGRSKASALARLAWLYVTQNRGLEGHVAATRALALPLESSEVERLAWSALVLAEGRLRGAPAGLEALGSRIQVNPSTVSSADTDLLVIRGTARFYAGQASAGAADLRVAIRLGRRDGATTQLPRAHLQLAQLLIILGDWDEALVHGRIGLSLVVDEGQVWLEGQAHAALGSLLASRGEWDSAELHINAALRCAAAVATDETWFTARVAQSAVARARNNPVGVITALAPLAGTGDSSTLTMLTSLGWWPPLIHALIDIGETDTAERHIRHLENAASDRGLDVRARIEGLWAGLALAQGHADRAAAGFDRAVSGLGPDDPTLDRAAIHHDYGRLLRALGRRSAAVAQFRTAHELLARAGAAPFRQRVDAELDASGIRSAPSVLQSPLALTDREQDVVALVAQGMTNRQVAAELYVSTKAVEYHLRNIFGKLGITSRRQLIPTPSARPALGLEDGPGLRP